MNMIKVLWCKFQQCLGTFTMLLVEGMSETGLFRHLSDHVSGVRNFGKSKSMRVIFFSKYLKFIAAFRFPAKNSEKVFCFWDCCIWISIVKLSLLRTGYFSSETSVLKSSCKIWHINKRDVLQLNCLGSDQWIWERCCDADFHSAWARLPCYISKECLKWNFLDIYLATFLQSVISENQNLWGSSFFRNL